MTLEQFVTEKGFTRKTRHTLSDGTVVYRLFNKNDDSKTGLPFFAIETSDGCREADVDETISIMNKIFSDDDLSEENDNSTQRGENKKILRFNA